MLRADLHIHTEYSMDCDTPLERIVARCQKLGINCIAVADHGTVEGALRMQELAPFPVVVAEEILTPQGEIMGVFLKETIPSGITIPQAISRIRAQGGLVCLPHPFDTLRRLRLSEEELDSLAAEVDIVEVFNARSHAPVCNERAAAFAERHGLARSAGSDAHWPFEIGHGYVEMPEFQDREGFLHSLARGRIYGRRSGLFVHLFSLWARLKKVF